MLPKLHPQTTILQFTLNKSDLDVGEKKNMKLHCFTLIYT
jgi:hypothetical protein